jgi:tRNA modification GTPase
MDTATVIACLTPPGKAAIATLGVRGPLAWDATRQLFQTNKGTLPEQPIPGRYWFGKLGESSRDEVILAVKVTAPYPTVELHCHGGIEVVRMIQELYTERGASLVSWEEYLGAPLLSLLARAPTTRTAAILLDQVSGAWARMLQQSAVDLVRLRELIPIGEHLVEPWKVVIAGPPNVGKSTLMNALAGYTRSIVSPIPGTTRDVVTSQLAIDGWPIEMTDTAGLREAVGTLEQLGIERARMVLQEADLRLWLFDGSTEPIFPDDSVDWCFLINKTDSPAAWDWQKVAGSLHVSAQTRAGLSELCEMISRRLVPHPPAPGEAVPCLPEQIAWVREQADGLVAQ